MSGIEKGHCPCSVFGIAFGYTAPVMLQDNDSIHADDLVFGLYFKKKVVKDLYVNFWIGYGHQKYKSERRVSVPTLDQGYKYEGEYDGNSFTSYVEISRAIYCKPYLVIRPIAAIEYQYTRHAAYTESGRGPFAVSYDALNYETVLAKCGVATQIGAADGSSKMTIRQRVYYARQLGDEAYPDGKMRLLTGGSSTEMHIRGMDVCRDYMILGAGGQFYLDPSRSCQLFGDYDAIVTEKMTTHAVSLGLIHRF